jgi:hypothetical protein
VLSIVFRILSINGFLIEMNILIDNVGKIIKRNLKSTKFQKNEGNIYSKATNESKFLEFLLSFIYEKRSLRIYFCVCLQISSNFYIQREICLLLV